MSWFGFPSDRFPKAPKVDDWMPTESPSRFCIKPMTLDERLNVLQSSVDKLGQKIDALISDQGDPKPKSEEKGQETAEVKEPKLPIGVLQLHAECEIIRILKKLESDTERNVSGVDITDIDVSKLGCGSEMLRTLRIRLSPPRAVNWEAA